MEILKRRVGDNSPSKDDDLPIIHKFTATTTQDNDGNLPTSITHVPSDNLLSATITQDDDGNLPNCITDDLSGDLSRVVIGDNYGKATFGSTTSHMSFEFPDNLNGKKYIRKEYLVGFVVSQNILGQDVADLTKHSDLCSIIREYCHEHGSFQYNHLTDTS